MSEPLSYYRHEEYITDHIGSWPEWRMRQAQTIQAQYETPSEPIDGFAVVPVDTTSETLKTLDHTLEQYVNSPLTSCTWPIAFYFNYPSGHEAASKKAQEMERMVGQVSESTVAIHALQWAYDQPVTMGRIRSDGLDQAMLHPGKPWLYGGYDVDLDALAPGYFDTITEAARHELSKIFFTSELRWGVHGDSLPVRIMQYRAWLRKACHSPHLATDANAVIRVDKCAVVGGFDHHVDVAIESETANLSRRCREKFGEDILHFVDGVPLTTNPRRLYAAIAAGRAPHTATKTGHFGTHSDEGNIRSTGLDPDTITLDPKKLSSLLSEMDDFHAEKLHLYEVSAEQMKAAKRSLGLVT
ncbi:MAG TPA: hypothetical protein VLG92_03665 [Candidatus Saccharimonadia bacterium]|nr:hypothetical protein [Candidatus Saccharimonadia bacterium]